MEKKEFIQFLDDIFKSNGFKKKGNNWCLENEVLIKRINLQKSKYGDCYYLNYGVNFRNLDFQKVEMHIFHRLGSVNETENKRIIELLDFGENIPDEKRKNELRVFIEKNMLQDLMNINSEIDIVNNLKKRTHLNDVSLVVKKYLNID